MLTSEVFCVGDLAQMVERSLSMREALGSMPRFSISVFAYFAASIVGQLIFLFVIVRSVVGLVVRISAFHADGPGSIPGRRINLFPSSAFMDQKRGSEMYVRRSISSVVRAPVL